MSKMRKSTAIVGHRHWNGAVSRAKSDRLITFETVFCVIARHPMPDACLMIFTSANS